MSSVWPQDLSKEAIKWNNEALGLPPVGTRCRLVLGDGPEISAEHIERDGREVEIIAHICNGNLAVCICYEHWARSDVGEWWVAAFNSAAFEPLSYDDSPHRDATRPHSAAGILRAGLGHMEDRAATYDKPEGERSMLATVRAFAATTGIELTEEQGWHFMTLLKLVRSQQGDLRMDSYEDGAAYFGLMGEAAAKERDQ